MGWFNSDWSYRQKITIDNTKVDSTESDFTVTIDLSDLDSDFWTNVKSDGGDIRITQSNGTTQQAVDLKNFDGVTDTGQVHFKASSISSVVDTDFYIYYGNAAASQPSESDTYGAQNAYDSNTEAYWHLEEDPTGSPPQMLDSTANNHDGTTNGMAGSNQVTGKIGSALDFESLDRVDKGFKVTSTSGTLMMWIKASTTVTNNSTPCAQNSASNGWYGFGIQYTSSNDRWNFELGGPSGSHITYVDRDGTNWQHVAFTYTTTATEAFDNGSSVRTAGGATIDNNTQNFHLGVYHFNAGYFFYLDDAILDEVSLHNVVRSDGWIGTTYNNQNSPSTFYSFGGQEISYIPQLLIWQ
jgi:hypothetical protein